MPKTFMGSGNTLIQGGHHNIAGERPSTLSSIDPQSSIHRRSSIIDPEPIASDTAQR